MNTTITSTLILFALGAGPSGGPYEITRTTIDGGGVMRSAGGAYELSGTTGQADAGAVSGGAYALTGGFWFAEPAGDCDATGTVDLLDYADLFDCLLGPDIPLATPDCDCFDFDNDNDTDLQDFSVFADSF